MDRLDDAVVGFLRSTLLAPERIEALMIPLLTHREDWTDRRRQHVVELRVQADEAEPSKTSICLICSRISFQTSFSI